MVRRLPYYINSLATSQSDDQIACGNGIRGKSCRVKQSQEEGSEVIDRLPQQELHIIQVHRDKYEIYVESIVTYMISKYIQRTIMS